MSEPPAVQNPTDPPEAVLGPDDAAPPRGKRRLSWYWIIPALAAGLAVVLVSMSWWASGLLITIRFDHGHRVSPGDRLRHRGIEVGEVRSVVLDDDLSGVLVEIQLDGRASGLARTGSRFWIERPQVTLTRVSGLETIVGGQYVAVIPGPPDGRRQTSFEGLSSPPVAELTPGGLELQLEADQLGGLFPRAPVTYRGVQVGRILSVGLATDAATVIARAHIDPAYIQLVRTNSQFWRKSGVDVSLGLSGVQLDVESLSSFAMGGVSFATEDPPGEPVQAGHSFTLHATPDDAWLAWKPHLPVGSELLPDGLPLPQPLRASLRWQERSFGIQRKRHRQGWVLPVEGKRLIGPGDLLAPDLSEDADAHLAIAGREVAIRAEPVELANGAAGPQAPRVIAGVDVKMTLDAADWWPASRMRVATEPEDCLIVGATDTSVVPAARNRFHRQKGTWRIDSSLPLNARDHHGACVTAIRDGSLIGVALIQDEEATVALLTAELIGSSE